MFSLKSFREPTNNKKTRKRTTKMNCSPMVAGKTISVDTCMTGDILQKIKYEYNHTNRDNPIKSKNPKDILIEFRERLSNCSQEDCWLNQIKDKNLRTKIEKYIFAPKRPKEWKYNPTEWLSNFDIFHVLTQFEEAYPNFEFIGPSFIDFNNRLDTDPTKCVDMEVCKFSLAQQITAKRDKIAIVFNLDRHDQSGSHWVSMWIDIKDKFIMYFDSTGVEIPKEFMHLVDDIKKQGLEMPTPIHFKFFENHPFQHQTGNTECGIYSLFFIITMLTNKTEKRAFRNWRQKVKFFKSHKMPDKCMENLRFKYFNE
jgi:hypothetical protein